MSEDAMSNPDKLLVLIHGSGAVRAGQWARRLVLLLMGTSFSYINILKKLHYIISRIHTIYSGTPL